MKRRVLLQACAAAPATMLAATAWGAESYPAKPLRFIMPFTAGGPTDVLSRAYAKELSQILGQPVVVDNKPGAGGNLGVNLIAKAPADGYTIGLGTNGPLAINATLFSNLPYDPQKDLAPITRFAFVPNVLLVPPSLGVNDVEELLRRVRATPGKYSFASGGNGTSQHLAGEMLKTMGKLDITHVPYKGESPAIIDVIGGQVQMSFSSLAASLPHIRSGRLLPLAVTSAKRNSVLPDVPTLAEKGFPGYEATAWYGIVAPAQTPPEILRTLREASLKAFATTEVTEKLAALSATLAPTTQEEFAAFIRSETARWAPVVRASGAKVD
jgi:tripartite-type tricarboxylate transporter receptor subunit TctC